jgi:hypothetical protein
MSNFPTLKTGAVLQYPAQRQVQFATAVVRYIDGSEQRFRTYAKQLHRWMIRLDMLDESELHQLREFFRTQNGAARTFAFIDPWDGNQYPACSIEEEEMIDTLGDESNAKASLTIRENGN